MSKIFLLCLITLTFSSPVEFFVSPNGNDDINIGTEEFPFRSISKALSSAVLNKSKDGTIITLISGTYIDSIVLSAKHSGFTIRGNGNVVLSGGVELKYNQSYPCDCSIADSGIDCIFASNIRKWKLSELGITDLKNFWIADSIKKERLPMILYGDSIMPISRWPDTGFITIDSLFINKPKGSTLPGYGYGDSVGRFIIDIPIPSYISNELPRLIAHGYWCWHWYDDWEIIDSIYTNSRIIRLKEPAGSLYYGYRQGQYFYMANILHQIDQPGKWAIDTKRDAIYYWMPDTIKKSFLSYRKNYPLKMNKVSNIKIDKIRFNNYMGGACMVSSCTSCVLSKCEINNISGIGVEIKYSDDVKLINSEIKNIGHSAIKITNCGVKTTLSPSNIMIVNNKIHDYGKIRTTYVEGINISTNSIGCIIRNNEIFNSTHMGIFYMGNNHLIENNYIHHVCIDHHDCGVLYCGRDWTSRGTVIRNNFIEKCGTMLDVNAIYLDDLHAGIVAYGNIIKDVDRAFKIGGGRDHHIYNNVVINSRQWLTNDTRGLTWAKQWVDSGGTCWLRLKNSPYTNEYWSSTYPALLTILKDQPEYPKYSVVRDNALIDCGNPSISILCNDYNIVENNIKMVIDSLSFTNECYGIVDNPSMDTIPELSFFKQQVTPLVRSVSYADNVITIKTVPSFCSDSLHAELFFGSDIINWNKVDTVEFDYFLPGNRVLNLWYDKNKDVEQITIPINCGIGFKKVRMVIQ